MAQDVKVWFHRDKEGYILWVDDIDAGDVDVDLWYMDGMMEGTAVAPPPAATGFSQAYIFG